MRGKNYKYSMTCVGPVICLHPPISSHGRNLFMEGGRMPASYDNGGDGGGEGDDGRGVEGTRPRLGPVCY